MKRFNKKIICVFAVIAVLLAVTAAVSASFSGKSEAFRYDAPTFIKPNSRTEGQLESSDDYEAFVFETTKNGVVNVTLEHDDNMAATLLETGWKVSFYSIQNSASGKTLKLITYFDCFWSDVMSGWGEIGVGPGQYLVVVEAGSLFIKSDFTLVTVFNATEYYEQEFNDTKETATPLRMNGGKYGASGQRTEGNDVDWYKFTLEEDSCVELLFEHEDLSLPQASWGFSLFTESDKLICDFSSSLADPSLETGKLGLKAGTYYVMIDSYVANGATYTITLKKSNLDKFEYEPNNSPETANQLPVNSRVSGALAPRILGLDKDMFEFEISADGYLNVFFDHDKTDEAKIGWNLRVLRVAEDGSVTEIIKKTSYLNEVETKIENLGLKKGTYYFCIDADSAQYTNSVYTLGWQFIKKENFEKETNNTKAEAEEIRTSVTYHGALLANDMEFDNDYYKVTFKKDTRVCLEFSHEVFGDSKESWDITLIDPKGRKIATVSSKQNQNSVYTDTLDLTAGTYYIHIGTGIYESTQPYSFRLIAADEYE